jgi:hypothetical protein
MIVQNTIRIDNTFLRGNHIIITTVTGLSRPDATYIDRDHIGLLVNINGRVKFYPWSSIDSIELADAPHQKSFKQLA